MSLLKCHLCLTLQQTLSIVLKVSSTNLPAVCAIISFTETRLTFVVFVLVKQILPRKTRPRYFYLPPRPPAARGSLFLQELFYTNASLRGVKRTTKRGSLSSPWLFNIQTLRNRIANGRLGRSPFEIKAACTRSSRTKPLFELLKNQSNSKIKAATHQKHACLMPIY